MSAAIAAAAVGVAGAVGGAIIGSKGAGKAADAQVAAADRATQSQLQMYNQTRSDLEPYMAFGNNAFSQLANIFGFGGKPGDSGFGMPNSQLATEQLTKMPGYQFGLQQGEQALNRQAASQGRHLSGAQMTDAMKFGTGYAMQQAWQPYVSELNWATGIGQNAAAGVGNAGIQTGQGVAGSQLAGGQAAAGGAVAGANQWGNAFAKISDLAGGAISSYANPQSNYNWGTSGIGTGLGNFDFSGGVAPGTTFDLNNLPGMPSSSNGWSMS